MAEALAPHDPANLTVLPGPREFLFSQSYLAGVQAAAQRLGMPTVRVIFSEMTQIAGEALATAEVMRPRSAIAGIQDTLAFGVYRAAAKAPNVAIGQTLAVFGGQNFPGSELSAPTLSTFSTHDSRVAELITQVLIHRLGSTGKADFQSFVVQPELRLRASHALAR